MSVRGLVRGAAVPVLGPLASRIALAAPAVVVVGADGGAGVVAAGVVRALVACGAAPEGLVVSARARAGSELGDDDATVDASESARCMRAAGAVRVRWLRVHPESAESALRELAAAHPAARPLVIDGALALAVLEPRLALMVTARAQTRPDPQVAAVETLVALSVSDASETLLLGLARLALR